MRNHALLLALVPFLYAVLSDAVRVPMRRVRKTPGDSALQARGSPYTVSNLGTLAAATGGGGSELNLTTARDLLYIANVTIGDNEYPVQLDTGSSDLWVHTVSSPIPNSHPSTTAYNLTYDIGWAFGNISYATVEFAGLSVSSQAFLDAPSAVNPALAYGALGILGLGFDSLSSIDALVNRTGTSTGRSFLYNAFAETPHGPNFIAFSLQSALDNGDEVEGVFSIGEYEPEYAAVANSSAISTWPQSYPSRWNVLLDALLVGSGSVALSSDVGGVPANKAVVMLDSGTSYTYAPTAVVDAVYSQISGAQFEPDLGQWLVPCSEEVDVALQFGDSVYPINPLDMTVVTAPSTCAGTLINQTITVADNAFDWLIGDNMLRSVYSVYDFGDYDSSGNMGNPYIRLLSLVDPDKASVDFHQTRGGAPTNVTYNAANSSSNASGSISVTLSDDLAKTLNTAGQYLPVILALMALNTLVLLGLAAGAIVYMLRRRNKGARARKARGRTSPMPMNPSSTFGTSTSTEPHVYEPVSMALTDDTFVPPSPAFSKAGFGGGLRVPSLAERPKSVA